MNTIELRKEDVKPGVGVILRHGKEIMIGLGMHDAYDIEGEILEVEQVEDKVIARVEWDLKISEMKVRSYYDYKDLLKIS